MLNKLIAAIMLITAAGYLFASHDIQAAGGGSHFSNLGIDEGLSQMSVMKIYQDSKGYIWLGTRNGLNKYDGHSVIIYKPDNDDKKHSLVDRQITAITEDSDRSLWIGTGKGLSRLDTEIGRITSYPSDEHPWLSSGVRSLLIDSDGNIWVGTQRGLYKFDPVLAQATHMKL